MFFRYSDSSWQNQQWETKHLVCRPSRWPCRCIRAMDVALFNVACPGLLRKPLDATIGRLLTPYCLGGNQGDNQQTYDKNTPTLLAISMAIAMCGYYTEGIAWWRRSRAFLKATKCRYPASTCSDIINRACLPMILGYISSSNHWKRAWVDLITIGVWHINLMKST